MKAFYILLLTVFLASSCNSVKRTQKFVARGDYDRAISLAVKKLQKDKTAPEYEPHIQILEEAYSKANQEDLRHISYLKRENSLANAKEIYYTYLDLQARQNLIRPLLPLYSPKMGRNAAFVFSDFGRELAQAKENYVQALYKEAQYYFNQNSKEDYRSAYNVLCELEEVRPHYKDVAQLKEEARFRGTEFVLVSVNNHTGQFIPLRLERDLLDFNTYNLDQPWIEFHGRRERNVQYDLSIALNFERLQISPERIVERQFERKQQVADGYEIKRDRRGNIIRDSIGNPIKIEKIKTVSAIVTETLQEKAVFLEGTVVYKDLRTQNVVQRFPLISEFVFENAFATYRGDDRALTREDRILVNNRFVPFPNNEQMVFDAGMDIKERLKEIIKKSIH